MLSQSKCSIKVLADGNAKEKGQAKVILEQLHVTNSEAARREISSARAPRDAQPQPLSRKKQAEHGLREGVRPPQLFENADLRFPPSQLA